MKPYSTCITSSTKMVDMIASNHISELSVPASARALLFRESSVGGVSYKVKKAHRTKSDELFIISYY